MPTKPFNQEFLWKSAMERSGNTRTPTLKESMILPKINTVVGGTMPDGNDIHGNRVKRNLQISANYWAEVNERKAAYRDAYRYPVKEPYFAKQLEPTVGLEEYIFRKLWHQ